MAQLTFTKGFLCMQLVNAMREVLTKQDWWHLPRFVYGSSRGGAMALIMAQRFPFQACLSYPRKCYSLFLSTYQASSITLCFCVCCHSCPELHMKCMMGAAHLQHPQMSVQAPHKMSRGALEEWLCSGSGFNFLTGMLMWHVMQAVGSLVMGLRPERMMETNLTPTNMRLS